MMSGTTPQVGVAMPEWLQRRDREAGAWNVKEGAARRGEAWTINVRREMQVPFGDHETNRVIRAHEMMHAKVTPEYGILGSERGISVESLRAAEEFRVNSLVRAAGFDTDALVDGSEKLSGQRLAQVGDISGLIQGVTMMANTKGAKEFIKGVRVEDAELAKALREFEKGVIKQYASKERRYGKKDAAEMIGSTRPCASEGWQGYTAGYRDFTIPLAQMLDRAIDALTPPPGDDEGDGDGDAQDIEPKPTDRLQNIKDVTKGNWGRWGPLVLDADVRPTKAIRGSLGRKRVATNVGRNPRRMNRMLADPQRRIFDRTVRGTGGVVLIDCSSSMSLSVSEIEQMMEASPGCTIIGYTHKRRTTDQPNIWFLAKNGKRVEKVPDRRHGNGIDGPALRFAIKQARRGEPIVWVCDGRVTSGEDDQVYENLNAECARLVQKHKIHMTADVPDGIKALHRIAKGERLPTKFTGNVRRTAFRLNLATV